MPSDASGSSEFPRALPAALSRTAVRPARASRTARPFRLRPGESLETRRLLVAGVGDLEVALRVGTSTITSDVVRQYSAAALGSAGWGTVDTSGKAATFRYVETHQFAIPDHDLGSPIAVKVAERDPKNNGIRMRASIPSGPPRRTTSAAADDCSTISASGRRRPFRAPRCRRLP